MSQFCFKQIFQSSQEHEKVVGCPFGLFYRSINHGENVLMFSHPVQLISCPLNPLLHESRSEFISKVWYGLQRHSINQCYEFIMRYKVDGTHKHTHTWQPPPSCLTHTWQAHIFIFASGRKIKEINDWTSHCTCGWWHYSHNKKKDGKNFSLADKLDFCQWLDCSNKPWIN